MTAWRWKAACLLAAMQAAAYDERDIDKLLDLGLRYSRSNELNGVIADVREQCAKAGDDWRAVRHWLGANHGYERYPGNCPMVPNHALLIASFLLGGDDFQKGLKIAVSSGWDTDCNAGNLGALNGIRLGLAGLETGPDFRGPVADLMYVVGADGGECVTDAVIETRRVLRSAAQLRGESYAAPASRFAFEFPGAVQGFARCPLHQGRQAITSAGNLNTSSAANGLELSFEGLAAGGDRGGFGAHLHRSQAARRVGHLVFRGDRQPDALCHADRHRHDSRLRSGQPEGALLHPLFRRDRSAGPARRRVDRDRAGRQPGRLQGARYGWAADPSAWSRTLGRTPPVGPDRHHLARLDGRPGKT
jgi:hypothetical protein